MIAWWLLLGLALAGPYVGVGAHLGLGLPAPAWYVWACLAFDLAVAAALAWRGVRGLTPHRV